MIIMSPPDAVICPSFEGSGMLVIQILNNVGDRPPLCVTPVLFAEQY